LALRANTASPTRTKGKNLKFLTMGFTLKCLKPDIISFFSARAISKIMPYLYLKLNTSIDFRDSAPDSYQVLTSEEKADLRTRLGDYVRTYAFLVQIITFTDADLEKFYQF